MTHTNSSSDTLGTVEWEITEAPDWRVIHHGSRDIRRDDIEVGPLLDMVRRGPADRTTQTSSLRLRLWIIRGLLSALRPVYSAVGKRLTGGTRQYRKRIRLESGFYFVLSERPVEEGQRLRGVGMLAEHNTIPTFSWEWFPVEGNREYARNQEGGRLRIGAQRGRSGWEIGYTEFLTDVSLGMKARDEIGLFGAKRIDPEPRWRVRIARGSHVTWPSVDELTEPVPPN